MFAKTIFSSLAVALSLAVVAGPQPAAAVQSPETVSIRIDHADLDLSRPAGAQAMVRRIRGAATALCGPLVGDPLRDAAVARCVREITVRSVGGLALASGDAHAAAARATLAMSATR